ncbi:hypothetical protein A2Z33_06030 [Candidatus Gottesmanbacteria bacterium RBG_16_52_11]|uniref:Uncharacterized protein n=1 Tax=Candidatus Gottesmanbacteria bacterium RBG_16_52_11 TaxID=1798374 RepID=A0A1F5YXZ8_9BACT|nr:MAG: hypothetical protein A2Z33_06030 [Candidatus Gottesmanbacteria bacterium RBG_16_52_11]
MGRPKCDYRVDCCVGYSSYKPEGYSSGDYIEISPEEIESLRLKNIRNLDQTEAAGEMGVSQSTFQRVLTSAYRKVSEALIWGKELRIVSKQKAESTV